MPRLLLTLLIVCSAVATVSAQKYGHLNFANLLSQMPATKAAESELATLNEQLTKLGEQMVADLRERVLALEGEIQNLAPVEVQKRRAALNGEREKIVLFEQKMGRDIDKKRQELLAPLIRQARDAIDKVAEANGYTLIFDTSQFNSILYGQDSDDILPLVKTELGM